MHLYSVCATAVVLRKKPAQAPAINIILIMTTSWVQEA